MMGLAQRRHEERKASKRIEQRYSAWGYTADDLKRNTTKPPGYEYWSRRPGSGMPGKISKQITHSIERARERQQLCIARVEA